MRIPGEPARRARLLDFRVPPRPAARAAQGLLSSSTLPAAGNPKVAPSGKRAGAPSAAAEPATLFRRLAALVYDAFLVAALEFAFTGAVIALRGREIPPGTPWYLPVLVAIALGFYGWFWTRCGQTLGMQAWRIKVTAADGGPVRWPQAVLRFFAAWLSALPAGLGYVWVLIDPEKRAWHDRLSRTRTVRVR